jgi:uncharacterized spore protein YtfJ
VIEHASAKLVYGEPVQVGLKTVLPVARIRYGFGSGSGGGGIGSTHEEGAGGGGGLTAKPLGVVEISESRTRSIPVYSSWAVLAALGIGVTLGLLLSGRQLLRSIG